MTIAIDPHSISYVFRFCLLTGLITLLVFWVSYFIKEMIGIQWSIHQLSPFYLVFGLVYFLIRLPRLIYRVFVDVTQSRQVAIPISIPVAIPETYPHCKLSDHPVKNSPSKEFTLNWLLKNTPVVVPLAMSDRFYFNDEWRIKYEPLPLESYSLAQLKKIAAHFGIENVTKGNVKQSWIDAIATKEQEHLKQFWDWSDTLARSLK